VPGALDQAFEMALPGGDWPTFAFQVGFEEDSATG
jgi:hypothetical protein